jgi:hypothetical protein
MHILIKKSISHPSTPLPFLPGECVTVPDELASEWIAAEKAVRIPGAASARPGPAKCR